MPDEVEHRAAELYRLVQAQEMLDRFEDAHGRAAATMEELETWAQAQTWSRPIEPSPRAFAKAKAEMKRRVKPRKRK